MIHKLKYYFWAFLFLNKEVGLLLLSIVLCLIFAVFTKGLIWFVISFVCFVLLLILSNYSFKSKKILSFKLRSRLWQEKTISIELSRATPWSSWIISETRAKKPIKYDECKKAAYSFARIKELQVPKGRYKLLTHETIKKRLRELVVFTKEKHLGPINREFICTALVGKKCPCKEHKYCIVARDTSDFDYYYLEFEIK